VSRYVTYRASHDDGRRGTVREPDPARADDIAAAAANSPVTIGGQGPVSPDAAGMHRPPRARERSLPAPGGLHNGE
jgi:hypothetical protein